MPTLREKFMEVQRTQAQASRELLIKDLKKYREVEKQILEEAWQKVRDDRYDPWYYNESKLKSFLYLSDLDLAIASDLPPFLIKINQSHLPRREAAGIPLAYGMTGMRNVGPGVNYQPYYESTIPTKEILTRTAGWAAIEHLPIKSLTFAHLTPCSRFFDWFLVGYKPNQQFPLIYDEEQGKYVEESTLDKKWPGWAPAYEREAQEELEMIDSILPLDGTSSRLRERANFFKNKKSVLPKNILNC